MSKLTPEEFVTRISEHLDVEDRLKLLCDLAAGAPVISEAIEIAIASGIGKFPTAKIDNLFYELKLKRTIRVTDFLYRYLRYD